VRKISPTGEVSTIAGTTRGFVSGYGSKAELNQPMGIAFYKGSLYVADCGNHCIRKICFVRDTMNHQLIEDVSFSIKNIRL
jgi:hypothetical protein